MKKRILFRADANVQIGYGHFVRTLALADMLKDDFECVFYTQEPTEYQKRAVGEVCDLVALPSDETKFDVFLSCLSGNEIVFLDNYFFTSEYERQIKRKGCKLVCLAPYNIHHYSDVLINYVEEDFSKYSVEPYTKILCGFEWVILRAPFRKYKSEKKISSNIITICFGGTDQYLLTEKTFRYLKNCKLQYEIHLIASSVIGTERIREFLSEGLAVHIDASAQEIANLFDVSKFAILSSSMICYEALSRGTKVLSGYYVDNQLGVYNALLKTNSIIPLGNLLDENYLNSLAKALTCDNLNVASFIDYSKQKEKYISIFHLL